MREPLWLAGLLAIGLIAALVVVPALRSDDRPLCRSALIPAYLVPQGVAKIAERPVHSRVVILNPSSGPHSERQPAYEQAVRALQRSGTRVLGYVHTGYGTRDMAAVEADISRYESGYGVDGVFLDEASHAQEQLPYYRALTGYVRAAGDRLVVLNPGTIPAPGYFDIADIVVTFEGPYSAYAAALRAMPDWVRRLAPGRSAHLIYGASQAQALEAVQQDSAGYVYATTGELPDPWSALPPYLDDFEARIEACHAQDGGAGMLARARTAWRPRSEGSA
ncbi:MAG: hypothetical protein QOD81_650 [Solirubrobacteraceae bacterium]|jgi:hypothetical protein|nr:hypothetical protein [Solirubrobacteraceae bacterium]